MREHAETSTTYDWIVYAVALLTVGGLAGYILANAGTSSARPNAPAAAQTTSATVPVADENQLRAYRDILARDPRNVQAAVSAANLLYDAQRYQEAIGFYEQAFAQKSTDINVSTDLGTALWYSGRPDEALAQYERSLAINATHAQTLFNIGIVKADGKRDYAGAIAAWEKLLGTNPDYPAVTRVQTLISDARSKISPAP
jgi:tetratricopeptide (TPR) repeat protein